MPVGSFVGPASPNSITGGGGSNQQKQPAYGPDAAVGPNAGSTGTAVVYPGQGGGVGAGSQGVRSQVDTGAIGSSTYMPPNYMANALAQQQAQQQAQYGGLSGLSSLVNTQYGPQKLALTDQLGRLNSLLDPNNPYGPAGQYSHNVGSLKADTALNQQLLALQQQGLGLEGGLAKGQLGNLSKLRDILAKQRGLTREQLDNQMGQFKVDETKLRDNAGRSQWDLRSDLTSRGAFNTIANERGTGRINRDLDYGISGINNQRTAADISFRNSMLGLDEKSIGYDNQQAALNGKLAQIGLDGKALGIKGEQLQNALADGLYNAGLGGLTNLNQLMDAIGSNNAQQSQLGMTMLQQIIGYSNLPPAMIQQIQALLGGGGAHPPVPPTRVVP